MSSVSAINPIIQAKLKEKREILSRQGSSDIYSPSGNNKNKYQENIVKTPYIIMVSTDEIQTKETKVITKDGKSKVVDTGTLVDRDYPTGFYMLSNQEYSSGLENTRNNPNINVGTDLYNARSLKKGKVPYRPAPGIKDLTSEFTSTNNTQFNRKVTVNFTCYSLEDLEILTQKFMTFNRSVFVQWGWGTDKKITPLIKEDGKVDYPEDKDPNDSKSEIVRLQELVIQKGQGNLDAVIGKIHQFSFTLREDGGFDCTTEILAQGINILDATLEQGLTNEFSVNKVRGQKTTESNLQYSYFTEEINDLHNNLNNRLDNAKGTQNVNLYENYLKAEGLKQIEGKDGKLTYASTNTTNSKKQIKYSKNFIVSQVESQKLSDSDGNSLHPKDNKWNKLLSMGNVISQVALSHFEPSYESEPVNPEECWVRWGWFEDNIINKYFALVDESNKVVSSFRSIQALPTTETIGDTLDIKKDAQGNLVLDENNQAVLEKFFDQDKIDTIIGVYNDKGRDKEATLKALKDTFNIELKEFPDKFYESTKIESDKNFKTIDIKQFLFPGKFSMKMETLEDSDIVKGHELNEKYKDQHELKKEEFAKNLKNNSPKEYEILKNYQKLVEKYPEYATGSDREKRIKALRKLIEESSISVSNIDQVTETGADKYLFLNGLEEVCNQLDSFDIESSFDKDEKSLTFERGSGYLRNIFINVKHLQSIFGNTSAVTLGETFNVLFSSLSNNMPQELNSHLVVRYDQSNAGNYKAELRKISNTDYQTKVNQIKQSDGIYEFPVHQQDSLVLSQELSTDLNSTQFQVLMSKNLAEQAQFIDKKNLSMEHQINFTETDNNGNKSSQYEKTDLKPAYKKKGFGFGNNAGKTNSSFLGSDENWPITLWESESSSENISDHENRIKLKKVYAEHEKQAEKDLEDATKTFQELPFPYDINGVLKPAYSEYMNYKVKFKEDKDTKKKILKISDYGLIGLTTTLTMTGIAGIYPSNIFTTSYLPKKFRDNTITNAKNLNTSCHFWTTGVTQNCSAESWTTQLEARMAWRYKEEQESNE